MTRADTRPAARLFGRRPAPPSAVRRRPAGWPLGTTPGTLTTFGEAGRDAALRLAPRRG